MGTRILRRLELLEAVYPHEIVVPGTAFAVGADKDCVCYVSCKHVLFPEGITGDLKSIRIGGVKVDALACAFADGPDLALLRIDLPKPDVAYSTDPADAPFRLIQHLDGVGDGMVPKVEVHGFSQLETGLPLVLRVNRAAVSNFADFSYMGGVHTRISTPVGVGNFRPIPGWPHRIPGWELKEPSFPFMRGASGSPLIGSDGSGNEGVVGVLFAVHEKGMRGFAVSSDAINLMLAFSEWCPPAAAEQPAESASSDDNPPPDPDWTKGLDPDDRCKGVFGGKAARNGRKLDVRLLEVDGDWFYFDAVVSSTDGSDLLSPVRFFLHQSYFRNVQSIKRIRAGKSAVFEEISAEGVYTLGAQVKINDKGKDNKHKWVNLEYDLSHLRGLPKKFKSR